MGLDIYLKKCSNLKDSQKKESEYNKESERNWHFNGRKYDDLTDDEKESAREKDKDLQNKLGLNKYGCSPDKINIEKESEYKDHYFKIGYFRSSYNNSGINKILNNHNIGDLYYIFEPNDEYEFIPDWEESLKKAKEVINKLIDIKNDELDFMCEKVYYNEFNGSPNDNKIDTEEKALRLFIKEFKKENNLDSYSNNTGMYFKEPLEIYGIIQGVNKRFFVDEKLPCQYIVYKYDIDWYIQALEIVIKTVEYVLNQHDKDNYFLTWSS